MWLVASNKMSKQIVLKDFNYEVDKGKQYEW